MRQYSPYINLIENGRGVFCLDPSMGCSSGMALNKRGCYGDCYSANKAKIYGYDFSTTVLRHFKNKEHKTEILKAIAKMKFPFIRMGNSGDPSEDWQHTFSICDEINDCIKTIQLSIWDIIQPLKIVIITKHFNKIPDIYLPLLSKYNIYINTSVSAIDGEHLFKRLAEYNKLKDYCKSLLRVVTFNFNLGNEAGYNFNTVQNHLLLNDAIIDTAFRPTKNNHLLTSGIINASKARFNKSKVLISKHRENIYTGDCKHCPEMCGIKLK